jgi:hypothetical protein
VRTQQETHLEGAIPMADLDINPDESTFDDDRSIFTSQDGKICADDLTSGSPRSGSRPRPAETPTNIPASNIPYETPHSRFQYARRNTDDADVDVDVDVYQPAQGRLRGDYAV